MSEVFTIPPWVPNGVRLIYEVGPLKNECSRRLLTDVRMKPAWIELKKLVPKSDAPLPSYLPPSAYMQQRMNFMRNSCDLKNWELDEDLSDFDRLSAALYYHVIVMLSQVQEPVTWTVAEANQLAAPYLEAVKLCDAAIDAESILKWGNPPRLLKKDLVHALKTTREYLHDEGQMLLMKSNPRVLDRHESEESDRLRAHARSVAAVVRDLFGPFAGDFPHGPVTRIFMVSLDQSGDVDAMKKRVTKWCQAGPTPISTPA